MAVSNRNIARVVTRVKKEIAGLEHPSVTLVGKKFQSPFLVLIACILSLRTKDETTLPASQRLFRLARTPKAMLRLSVLQIQKAIYPVGFYKTKAKRIQGIARELVEKYDSVVPSDMNTLLTFNGVGRKTANLVLIEGYGLPGLCVDTHVHRISNRLGYVRTKTPEQTEFALRKKLPSKYWIEYNALLVVWGQNVCRPVSPKCSRCAVKAMCARVGVQKQR